MDTDIKEPESYYNISRYFLVLTLLWTLVVASSCLWTLYSAKKEIEEAARIHAVQSYKKDVLYRRWNNLHGGVYVAVGDETQPNPFLADNPERDIETPSGKQLTLVNPAYMMRQVSILGEEEYGMRAHITSLQPINPENMPDPWEARALTTFEKEGVDEVSSIEVLDGEDYMRLMRPLYTEKKCISCHATQGYSEGEIRGGISVSIPMKPLMTRLKSHLKVAVAVYIALWASGLLGLVLVKRRLDKSEVKRLRAEDELMRIATTDSLTGAYNRAKFDELIVMEIARVRRFDHPLSVIFLDIDHFKKVNDTYGHDVGDEVLKAVADIVRANMRETNYFVRWGGEEFMILAFETGLDGARMLAERVRREIAEHTFGVAGSLTVSLGISLFNKDTDSVESFIKRADGALYRAKENGRNRTVVAE